MPNQAQPGRAATEIEPGPPPTDRAAITAALRTRHDGGFYDEIEIEFAPSQGDDARASN